MVTSTSSKPQSTRLTGTWTDPAGKIWPSRGLIDNQLNKLVKKKWLKANAGYFSACQKDLVFPAEIVLLCLLLCLTSASLPPFQNCHIPDPG